MAAQGSKPKNLASLAHYDTIANGGKWSSRTVKNGGLREIYHYSTLMMQVILNPQTGEVARQSLDVIYFERPGGSVSDKCGISRIRSSLLSPPPPMVKRNPNPTPRARRGEVVLVSTHEFGLRFQQAQLRQARYRAVGR